MSKTWLTITVVVVLFLLGLILWNIRQGHLVTEIGIPGGGSVKFEEKTKSSISMEISDEKKQNNKTISQKNGGTAKTPVRSNITNRSGSSGVLIEQHTEGSQSPAVNTGRDATITYEQEKPQ